MFYLERQNGQIEHNRELCHMVWKNSFLDLFSVKVNGIDTE